MPNIQVQHKQANLGWLFYKNYFQAPLSSDLMVDRNHTITDRQFIAEAAKFEVTNAYGFQLYTTYPGLLVGSGYSHEYEFGDKKVKETAFKIGFFFDYVTGMPCIPGHGVKGALRTAFPNHKNEKYVKEKSEFIVALLADQGINCEESFTSYLGAKGIGSANYSPTAFATLLGETIFEGNEPVNVDSNGKFEYSTIPLYKRDIFHDAYIVSGGKDNLFLANDYITPHKNPLKNPVPIQFLKVLPGVGFQFQFDLRQGILEAAEKEKLFKTILLTLGIGAKTNVGYGQFTESKVVEATAIQLPTQAQSDILPNNWAQLRKGNKFKGEIVALDETHFKVEFMIGNTKATISRKLDKLKKITPEVGLELLVTIDQDYNGSGNVVCKFQTA